MRIRTTDCCSTQKGSGFVMTQEQSKQTECQTLIFYVQDFLARHSLSPESEEDLQMPEELCSSSFTPSSVRYLSWGMVWNGKCLTARILESPNPESGCILSDILIEDVPEKYYLSQQQMERLLFKSRQADRGNESTKPKG